MLRVPALLLLCILVTACAPAAIPVPTLPPAPTSGATASATLPPPSVTATLYPVLTDTPAATHTPSPIATETPRPASATRPTNTPSRTLILRISTPTAVTRAALSAQGTITATRQSETSSANRGTETRTGVRATGSPTPTRLPATPTPTRTPTHRADVLSPILPDLRTLPPTDLVIEMTPEDRRLLRLTNMIINWGPGTLEVVGKSDPNTGRTVVLQNLYRANGNAYTHPAGIFIFHLGHNHWHFENFATYQVWSLTSEGKPNDIVGVANKVSYCLQDTGRSVLPDAKAYPLYVDCEAERQGMSSGWIDTYEFDREGQEIDITDLSDGVYMVQSVVDPENRLVEWSEDNNIGIVYFVLRGETVTPLEAESVPLLISQMSGDKK